MLFQHQFHTCNWTHCRRKKSARKEDRASHLSTLFGKNSVEEEPSDDSLRPRKVQCHSNRGVKQKFEGLHEVLRKKHAMEYAKLKEYEEIKASENGTNEGDEMKDKGWKNKIEEILSGNPATVEHEVSQS